MIIWLCDLVTLLHLLLLQYTKKTEILVAPLRKEHLGKQSQEWMSSEERMFVLAQLLNAV